MSAAARLARAIALPLAGLWLATGPVAAATSPEPPQSQPLLITSGEPADQLRLGDTIAVAASGLIQTREAVPCVLTWDGAQIGTCTADGSGTLSGTLTVPADAPTGPHVIQGCLVTCAPPAVAPARAEIALTRPRLATANVVVLARPVIVPHLQGLTATQAAELARRHHLSVDHPSPGTYVVRSQHPHAGAKVLPGTTVHLVLVPPRHSSTSPSVSSSRSVSTTPSAIGTTSATGVSIRLDGGMALLLGGFALAGVSGVRLRARRLERERQRSRRWVRDHLSARAAADPGLDADLGASSDRGSLSAPRLSLRGIPDPTHDSDEVKAGQS